ncbi:MAG: hypothetical protein RLZZ393_1229 [Pseudomonadota bacterium]
MQRRAVGPRHVTQGIELFEHELHADADELEQFRVGILVGRITILGIDLEARDFGEVLQDLRHLATRRVDVPEQTGADAVEETLAPLPECRRALGEIHVIARQQRLELHFLALQGFDRGLENPLQRPGNAIDRAAFRQYFGAPVLEGVGGSDAQRPDERTVGLGCIGNRPRPRQRALQFRITGSFDHRRIMPEHPCRRLTPERAPTYSFRMAETPPSHVDQELRRLEQRMDELVTTVLQLKEENRALRQRQDAFASERASLLQKNEQVRARVEAMIGRLRTLEQGA